MIVQGLKLVLEEADLSALLSNGLSAVNQVKELSVKFAPGCAKLSGKFQVGFAIPFETQWTAEVLDFGRKLGLRLSDVSVGFFGMNADAVRTQLMDALAKKLEGARGAAVDGDVIVVEPALLLAAKSVRLEAPIKRLTIQQGCVELEI